MAATPRIIVVGGGLAGLMATIKVAEAGVPVDLFSLVPVKRSHSVCAQGGINGAVNTKGEGDSPWEHFDDSIYGGDFLANQPPVKAMCDAAPGIIYLLDRMGVTFNRTPEGLLDFRRFGGTKHHRTAFAGATTGQQLLYALDEQVRRHEADHKVTKYETWDMMSPVLDDEGRCVGIIAQELNSMEIRESRADAVIMATGGNGLVFGRSTLSQICHGSAAASAYQHGVKYANGEFIQVHPTAIPGEDKLRLMSESARGEGGRVWVPKDGKPWYFLEEMYPAYGNLVPRDIATRAIFKVVTEMGLGVDGKRQVYLDVSHMPTEVLNKKLGGILEIYEKFVGEGPRKGPMRIFPAVHYSMGGLWVDFDQMTNIPGLFAVGECEYQYHGANRLGANSLLSTIYSGMVAGPNAVRWSKNQKNAASEVSANVFNREKSAQETLMQTIYGMKGTENPHVIHEEMGNSMTDNVTVVRHNTRIQTTIDTLHDLKARWHKIGIDDSSTWSNRQAIFTRHLKNMLDLAQVIAVGALMRDESRGAHYKPDFPERNDEQFLKTTIANYTPDGPKISYEAVDTSLIVPRTRNYDVEKKVS
ncbi:MAG: succinate dehydrogenase flavoprotein subunit [Candidatus Sericytochromatia bacterium]|nr:succinate dehydrogenase flavoprotein subunit [Candidatus Sericytochromatia bacterium]